jgi:hypothetical protein
MSERLAFNQNIFSYLSYLHNLWDEIKKNIYADILFSQEYNHNY